MKGSKKNLEHSSVVMRKCREDIIQAIEIAQEHLEQPDEVVDNKSYWQELYDSNISSLRTLLYLEEVEKSF